MSARTAEKKTALRLPERFRQLKSLHEDPPMSVPYGYVSEGTESFLFVSPVEKRDAMPFHDPETVIDGIRRELGEDQGIIEVVNGITREQRRYIYSVVKTLKRMQGVQYNLTMHLERADDVLQVQGFFSEANVAGARDALVFALLEKQGEIRVRDSIPEGWVSDPYDPWYTRGIRMNRSEQERFDVLFPAHPLSELRKFVKEIIVDN